MNSPLPSAGRQIRLRGRKVVRVSEIVWIEGAGPYSLIHFQDRTILKVAIVLSSMALRLPELTRIHRRQLINLAAVQQLERCPNGVVLITGELLPVARRRWLDFHRSYLNYRSN